MSATATLTTHVMDQIRDRITRQQLSQGSRLPSIRAMAEAQKVSKSTVVEAYDRLLAEGVIAARRGSGFFVAASHAPLALADIGPKLDLQVDPLWVSRQSLETETDYLKPGCGWLPASWMPEDDIRRSLRTLARSSATNLTEYATPLGYASLRQLLSRRLSEHGIEAAPAQIMVTGSGTQSIDLVCRFLLSPGDTVLVDDPCYFNFLALLRAHRVTVVGVPVTPSGPDINAFADALITHKPRLYITNSALHNPTGATLSPVTAHRLLRLAQAHDLLIIEDDIYADFEHTPAPRLAAFDGLERVIHIGSFSKTLSAAVRCGFIAAKPEWIAPLIDLKIATTFSHEPLAAELIYHLLSSGHYRKHIADVREKLAVLRPVVAGKLAKIGIQPWHMPQAGMLLWCQLPEEIDASEVARLALTEKVVLAPGNAFSLSQGARSFMRFNIAQMQDARVYDTLERAMSESHSLTS
ncbi:HTH-type transcriptional regulator NorG [Asticcacaulis sp. MM231]|uniref:aminotransferase-like domain-containing protein n=1 Tax=Asticcacaulis sp. MM231 TaxID=3157666 RepID=UPI0032D57107